MTHAVIAGKRRRVERLLWLVALILTVMLGFVTSVTVVQPGLFGLEQVGNLTRTAGAFDATGAVLGNTAIAAQVAAESVGQTAAALNERIATLDARETQSAEDLRATSTSAALANARLATSVALDFRSTQVAFDQEATQVELNYRGTQAALNRDATALALGFVTQAPPAQFDPTLTPLPTLENAPFFEDGFIEGVNSGLWRLGNVADWGLNAEGQLLARRDGAWLLTQIANLTAYTLTVDLRPLSGTPSDIFLLLNDPSQEESYALRLTSDGTRLTNAGLYRYPGTALIAGLLTSADLTPIQAVQVPDFPPSQTLSVTVDLRGASLNVRANGQVVLSLTLSAPILPGSVGVQVPADTAILRVALAR